MKKKIIYLLLTITMLLGVVVPSAGAVAGAEELYFMEAASATEKKAEGGQVIRTKVYGGLNAAGNSKLDAMGSFTLTLDYPQDQLKLVSLAPTKVLQLIGAYDQNQGSLSYNANTATGVLVRPGEGMLLAEAVFEILPTAQTGDVTIGITGGEIVRYRDKFTSCYVKPSTPVHIDCTPMISLPKSGSVQDTFLEPEFFLNPAGTLVSAVYSAGGQMLRCQTQEIPADAGRQKVTMNLSGSSYVKMFLLNSSGYGPVCPAARMELK